MVGEGKKEGHSLKKGVSAHKRARDAVFEGGATRTRRAVKMDDNPI